MGLIGNLYPRFFEDLVTRGEWDLEIVFEEGLIICADLDAKVQDLQEESRLERLGHVLRLCEVVKGQQVGTLLISCPDVLVLKGELLRELFLEIGANVHLIFSDLGVKCGEAIKLSQSEAV